jgi:ABC-type glycerol-3-phosphate transport system permease component
MRRIALVALYAVLALILLFPLYWAVLGSLRPEAEFLTEPSLLPGSLTSEHYAVLFGIRSFWVPVRNSLVVATVTTALCLVIGSLCAYALARLRFRGQKLIVYGILAISMFPQISVVPPLYLVLRSLGLINTFGGLVLPYLTFALPLTVWLLVGTFRKLPQSLEEAAMIDGASRLRTLVQVVAPVALPGIAAAGILTFVYCWNEFLFALSFTVGPERQTVPVAIALFRGQYQVPWGQVLAGTVIATAPAALAVLLFQRRITQAFAGSGTTG